jgi:hypothetical protein
MPLYKQQVRTPDERLEQITRQVQELGSVVKNIETLLAEKQQKLDEARERAKLTQAQFEKLTRNQETIMACLLKAFPQVNFDELNTPRTDGETRPLFFCFLLFLFQCLFVCLFLYLKNYVSFCFVFVLFQLDSEGSDESQEGEVEAPSKAEEPAPPESHESKLKRARDAYDEDLKTVLSFQESIGEKCHLVDTCTVRYVTGHTSYDHEGGYPEFEEWVKMADVKELYDLNDEEAAAEENETQRHKKRKAE